MDSAGITDWEPEEKFTKRLGTLLEAYTDGFSVPKEMIQNADDARASCVRFLFDERVCPNFCGDLLYPDMKECFGPALWVYNDAVFTEQDLTNIKALSNSIKENDLSKVGKLGHGFCSVYNLTDIPSFISAQNFVIFDPHAKYVGSLGKKINLKEVEKEDVPKVKNHLCQFEDVFGYSSTKEDEFQNYDGTLFHLPLRTANQAKSSDISEKPYTRKDMQKLLDMFVKNAGNLLLFTQNVKSIEFYHLPSGASSSDPGQPTLLFRVNRTVDKEICSTPSGTWTPGLSVLEFMSSEMKKYEKGISSEADTLKLSNVVTIEMEVTSETKMLCSVDQMHFNTKWLISWASGTDSSVEMAKKGMLKDALPLASTAALLSHKDNNYGIQDLNDAPFGFYKTSHLFCFQPLPVETPLPVHVNGCFAIAHERREISQRNEDDTQDVKSQWNESMMADAVCNAFLQMLNSLKFLNLDQNSRYHTLWPVVTPHKGVPEGKLLLFLEKAFYTSVVQQNHRIFKYKTSWTSFDECRFLDPAFQESDTNLAALNAAVNLSKQGDYMITELPRKILQCFEVCGFRDEISKKLISVNQFFRGIFFPNIQSSYWNNFEDDRDRLVVFAVECTTPSFSDILRSSSCIPVESDGELRKPGELVHPQGSISSLFSLEDRRFVKEDRKIFFQGDRLEKLVELCMMKDELPDELVTDRANSVLELSEKCEHCALERSQKLLKYLCNQMHNGKMNADNDLIQNLGKVEFLPVLSLPENLQFKSEDQEKDIRQPTSACSCHDGMDKTSERLTFESPCNLFSLKAFDLVSATEKILDEKLFKDTDSRIFPILGVRGFNEETTPIQTVVKQLICVGCNAKEQTKVVEDICHATYRFLNTKISTTYDDVDQESINLAISELEDHPVILVQNKFVKPNMVAMSLDVDCSPYLFGVNDDKVCLYRPFLENVGIKNHFYSVDFLAALLKIQQQYTDGFLPQEQLDLLLRLIKQLTNALHKENIVLSDLLSDGDNRLMLPSRSGYLFPVEKLCTMDQNSSNDGMEYVHDSITEGEAQLLGIKSQELQELMVYSQGLPFGPYQDITTRIEELLSWYPCDTGIFKELIQNADDAGATEIVFLKDFNQYGTDKVFTSRWKLLQGPALLVYNNVDFTPEDIEGIQRLSLGTKADDLLKTGQFGVGFNAVYNLTDVPSFLTKGPNVETGEALCIFDPKCAYAPGAAKKRTGVQYNNLSKWRSAYPDVFACYNEHLLKEKGTIFRFPLRNEEMAVNKKLSITRKEATETMVEDLFSRFKTDIFDMFLFLNNVRKISVLNIHGGEVKEEYTVEVVIDRMSQESHEDFVSKVQNSVENFRHMTYDLSLIEENIVKYQISLKDNRGKRETWLVVQKVGFKHEKDLESLKTIQDIYRNEKWKLFPRGGVAIQLDFDSRDLVRRDFKAFSFLPLPIKTGLPVHVNGHFALDSESRRNLWQEETEGFRTLWNQRVMQDVIAPAYVAGIQEMKRIVRFTGGEMLTVTKALNAKKNYHAVFPDVRKVDDWNWKFLASKVFEEIVNSKADVFVCLHQKLEQNQPHIVHVHYCQMVDKTDLNLPVFNDLHRQMDAETARMLTQLCKDIGMKLLDTPLWIYDIMEKLGIKDATMVSPDVILTYLSSLHGISGTDVSCTTLKSSKNVAMLTKYCMMSKSFPDVIENWPLCLTKDSHLQAFTAIDPVFCTPFSGLLPGLSNLFLHGELVPLFHGHTHLPVFREFNIQSFAELLPNVMDCEINIPLEWDPENKSCGTIPNSVWIKRLWHFLYKQFMSVHSENQNSSKEIFIQLLSPLSSICLLPCTQKKEDDVVEILCPIQSLQEILQTSTFLGNKKLQHALEVLNLPDLKSSVLPASVFEFLTNKILPNSGTPLEVLTSLFRNRDVIEDNSELSPADCFFILEYLTDNIGSIVSDDDGRQEAVSRLCSLPLFVTMQRSHVRIQDEWQYLVLKHDIPAEGLEEWGNSSRTILLKHRKEVKALFNLLDIRVISSFEFYAQEIFEYFHVIPKQHHLIHLMYIRDCLLTTLGLHYSEKQQQLLTALQELYFIVLEDGVKKKASDYYSPHNAVIEVMCHPQDFPPEPFCKTEWLHFMELAGMKKEVTVNLFVEFADSLEEEGKHSFSEDIALKSEVLIQHLFHRTDLLQEGLLQRISEKRFITPFSVSKSLQKIHEQHSHGNLISFSNSVLPDHQELVWTVCSILPFEAIPFNYGFRDPSARQQIIQQLGLLQVPPLEMVLQHIQNICDSLKEQIRKKSLCVDQSELVILMTHFYDYLKKHGMKERITKERLKYKPVVFLPGTVDFVTCDRVVIGLQEQETLKLYLVPAPEEFGPYFKLFESLGSSRNVTSDNYARVLHYLHIDIGENELNPNELIIAKEAIQKLFRLLPISEQQEEVPLTADVLYLPNRDKKLVDATELIYSDKKYLEKYLNMDEENQYDLFAGFPQLDIPFPTGCSYINRLPEKYRPRILSQIIQQDFDDSSVEIIESEKADLLCKFIKSMEFMQGILRLVADRKQSTSFSSNDISETEREDIISSLQNIHVFEVVVLRVTLILDGTVVGDENLTSKFQEVIEDDTSHWYFYFCTGEDTNWLQVIEGDFTDMIDNCLNNALGKNSIHLAKILNCVSNLGSIADVLDKNDIVEYSLMPAESVSLFPPAGTVIHPKWHHMLSDSFTDFHKGEYVAVLVFEEENTDEDPVYIYGRVIQVLPCDEELPKDVADVMRRYDVDVGENTTEKFCAYQIYKFNRGSSLSTSKELEPAVNAPKAEKFDDDILPDICGDIQEFVKSVWKLPEDEKRLIIKRLMRQWHPDKNIGNEEFASAVFDCITKTVEEMKTVLPEGLGKDSVDARNQARRPWHQDVNVVVGRQRQYQQQHSQQPTSHSYRRPERVPNPANARRWYKQAGRDLIAAQTFIRHAEDVDAYNWICYKCHQSAEKALKAVWFSIDANTHLIRSHDLDVIASQLEEELRQMAAAMTTLLGNHNSMRYPDMHRLPLTPSDIFSKEQAIEAINIAERICEHVSNVL